MPATLRSIENIEAEPIALPTLVPSLPEGVRAKAGVVKYGSARIDMLAIGIAMALAMLVRFNILPGIRF